jgi:hypothetical protein
MGYNRLGTRWTGVSGASGAGNVPEISHAQEEYCGAVWGDADVVRRSSVSTAVWACPNPLRLTSLITPESYCATDINVRLVSETLLTKHTFTNACDLPLAHIADSKVEIPAFAYPPTIKP